MASKTHQPLFRFCPSCGAGPSQGTLSTDDSTSKQDTELDNMGSAPHLHWPQIKQLVCRACNFTLFMNSATAVLGILAAKDHLLLAIRARDPSKYMLDFPGGFVDPGEGAEEALLRELEEEIGGLAIKGSPEEATALVSISRANFRYFGSQANEYHYKGVLYHPCDISYIVDISAQIGDSLPAFQGRDDVLNLVWLSAADLKDIINGKSDEVKKRWAGKCDDKAIFEFGFPSTANSCRMWLETIGQGVGK